MGEEREKDLGLMRKDQGQNRPGDIQGVKLGEKETMRHQTGERGEDQGKGEVKDMTMTAL